jgi:hypothetical protein
MEIAVQEARPQAEVGAAGDKLLMFHQCATAASIDRRAHPDSNPFPQLDVPKKPNLDVPKTPALDVPKKPDLDAPKKPDLA